jgi:hypothetical protein
MPVYMAALQPFRRGAMRYGALRSYPSTKGDDIPQVKTTWYKPQRPSMNSKVPTQQLRSLRWWRYTTPALIQHGKPLS